MRKTVARPPSEKDPYLPNSPWLNLEREARVEVSSEDAGHPIESALIPGAGSGWRAAEPGPQTLRVFFDRPQSLRHIRLVFEAEGAPRTQEFALRWSGDGGASFREVLRQQFNFSPPQTTRQEENYRVSLGGVTALELSIAPDLGGGPTPASLRELRLG